MALNFEGDGIINQTNNSQNFLTIRQFNIGKIAADKKPYETNNVIEGPHETEHKWDTQEDLGVSAGHPLLKAQNLVGVIDVYAKHFLTDSTLNSLTMVGDRITTVIERHHVYQAHQKLSRRNERLLASAQEGISALDLEGLTTFGNTARARMLRYEAQALIGVPTHGTIHHTKDGSVYPRETCLMGTISTNDKSH